MSRYVFLSAIGLALLLWAVPNARAHDGDSGDAEIEISVIGPDGTVGFDHNPDLDPYKGWFWFKIVRNRCDDPWGDFHFELKDIFGCDESDVVFSDDYGPLSSQTFSSPAVISDEGKTLDVYFYDDPIEAGDWAWFKVWTDNSWTFFHNPFRVTGYATPVPEPATLTLLGLGGLALWRRRR